MSLAGRFAVIVQSPPALAVASLFFANGFLFANWVVRIPSVKTAIALNDAQLGIALLSLAVGAVLAMPLGGALIAKLGSARIAIFSGAYYCAVFWLVGTANSLAGLCLALFFAGLGNGAMDVAMNAQADAVETRVGMRIMSFCHALWSAGLAVGTIPAGLLAAQGVPVALHLGLVGALLLLLIFAASRATVPDRAQDGPPQPLFALPTGPLLFFGIICFCGAVVEGGMNDWIAVFVEDFLGKGPISAATAFGAFAASMFTARLLGDAVTEKMGSDKVVRYGLVLSACGLCLALTSPFVLNVLGFALVGLGVASIFPAVFRAAGRLPGRAPGPSMAAAVTLGYGGFLFGPALIGFLAEWSSLRMALAALIPLCLLGAALAHTLRAAD